MLQQHNSQMMANGYFSENREKQNIFWLHHIIKEELGNKKYKQLTKSNQLQQLEKQLVQKEATIYQLLATL